jgi:hypothetical protein
MRSVGVVVDLVLRQHLDQVSAAGNENQVEDLGADGAYETLSEGVGLRGTHRGLQHPSPFGSKNLVEGCRVLGVAVPDEEADAI